VGANSKAALRQAFLQLDAETAHTTFRHVAEQTTIPPKAA